MTEAERHEIELLLPWYATGRLGAGERSRVQLAIAGDAGLRHQLDLIEQDLAQARAGNEAIGLPPALNPDRLMAMLPRPTGLQPVLRAGWIKRLKDAFSGPAGLQLRWAAVAAALLIIVQGGAIATLLVQQPVDGYEKAGGEGSHLPAGTYVLVRLGDRSTVADVARMLQQRSITIADGPRADGFFTLRVGEANMPAADRDAIISDLRSLSGLVVFAVPYK